MDRVRNYCNFSLCILLLQTEEVRNRSFLSVPLPRFSLKSKVGKGVLNSALSLLPPTHVTVGNSLRFSEPLFLYLQNGNNNNKRFQCSPKS